MKLRYKPQLSSFVIILFTGVLLYFVANIIVTTGPELVSGISTDQALQPQSLQRYVSKNKQIAFDLPEGWFAQKIAAPETFETFGSLSEAWNFLDEHKIVQFEFVLIQDYQEEISVQMFCIVIGKNCTIDTIQGHESASFVMPTSTGDYQVILIPYKENLLVLHWTDQIEFSDKNLILDSVSLK